MSWGQYWLFPGVKSWEVEISPVEVQYRCHVYHVTSILHCYWRKFWWRNSRLYKLYVIILSNISINNAKLKLKIITGANLRLSGFCGISSFNTTNFNKISFSIRFGIILTQFYINFSKQEHQTDFLCVLFKTWDSQVSAYTPFHFSFTVPLNFILFFFKQFDEVKFIFVNIYLHICLQGCITPLLYYWR